MMKTVFEIVFTVTDFYDGPREGVANFQAVPHIYKSVFDESVGYTDIFLLSPIDNETLQLELEAWAIWQRWELAFSKGLTDQSTHPALPEDCERHEQLQLILKDRLKLKAGQTIRARAEFQRRALEEPIAGVRANLEVKWTVIEELSV